jgi:hypothetical protein
MQKGFFAAGLIAGVVALGSAAPALAKNDKHGGRFDAGAFADHRRSGRSGDYFTGSSMPPGFSHGNRHGWSGHRPPGWSKGNKRGWSGNVPPGLDR